MHVLNVKIDRLSFGGDSSSLRYQEEAEIKEDVAIKPDEDLHVKQTQASSSNEQRLKSGTKRPTATKDAGSLNEGDEMLPSLASKAERAAHEADLSKQKKLDEQDKVQKQRGVFQDALPHAPCCCYCEVLGLMF